MSASLALAACTARLPAIAEDPGHELTKVPFFPQTIHQCGPAALATALGATGVAITPEELAPQVYIPGRRGSLQVEMLAAARNAGRLAYVIEPRFEDLRTELDAGNPVLVLQDLGGFGIRVWHFAVVIGYAPDSDVVILRSGTTRRRLQSRDRFLRSWQASDNWAAVVTRATDPPATATGGGFIRALTAAGRNLPADQLEAANAAALARWPADALVLLSNGNQAYAGGRLTEAVAHYRALLLLAPDDVTGRNNLANALLDSGCVAAARAEARKAATLVPADSPLAPAVADTVAKAEAAAGSPSVCGAE